MTFHLNDLLYSYAKSLDELAYLFKEKTYLFLSEFSFSGNDDSQDNRKRQRTILIPMYHFHPLTNMHTFICSLASEMTTFVCIRSACNYLILT